MWGSQRAVAIRAARSWGDDPAHQGLPRTADHPASPIERSRFCSQVRYRWYFAMAIWKRMLESGLSSFGRPRFFFNSPRRLFATKAENHAGSGSAEFASSTAASSSAVGILPSARRRSRFSRLVVSKRSKRLGGDDI